MIENLLYCILTLALIILNFQLLSKNTKRFGLSEPEPEMNNSTLLLAAVNSSSAGCSSLVSTTFTSILGVISIVTLVGNMLIVIAFIKTPSLRTSANYYIVNMAVSDFLGPFFSWPLYTSDGMLAPNVFISGSLASAVCKLGMYLRAVSLAVSILSLVLIALDRFVATVFPLKAMMIMNVRIRALFLALSWLIPIFLAMPYVLFAKIIKIDDQTFCKFMMSDGSVTIFNSIGIVLLYVFPLITIIALYVMIIRALKKTPNLLKGHENAKRRKQNHRIVKILISIVFVFFICWTPLCVYVILKNLHPSLFLKDNCLFLAGFSYYVFPSLSTAVNPVILFVFSTNYNQALRTVCLALFRTCKCAPRVTQLSCLGRIVTKPLKTSHDNVCPLVTAFLKRYNLGLIKNQKQHKRLM